MQVIGSYTSPFVRKIRILLHEKGLPFSFLEDIPWNEDTKTPKYNPLGKVPVLIDEHGSVWHDSRVIAQYVETLHALKVMIPPNPVAAAEVCQLEALADGITEAGVVIFLEQKREPKKQNSAWISRQHGKINRGMDALETKLENITWLHADSFGLADITAGAMLGWLDFRLPAIDWRKDRPRLTAYANRLFARESFQATKPPPEV